MGNNRTRPGKNAGNQQLPLEPKPAIDANSERDGLSGSDHQILVDSIAEKLVLNRWFQLKIAAKTLYVLGVVGIAASFGLTLWIKSRIDDDLDNLDREVRSQLAAFKSTTTNLITAEFETTRIKETVSGVASNLAQSMVRSEIEPTLLKFKEDLDSKLQSATNTLASLSYAAHFGYLYSSASANERRAFDTLVGLSKVPSGTSGIQESITGAVVTITDAHNEEANRIFSLHTRFEPPVETLSNPPQNIDQLATMFSQTTVVDQRVGIIQSMWDRSDLSRKAKLEFLVRVLKNEQNLRPLSIAGFYFREGSGVQKKTLETQSFLEWWVWPAPNS